MEDQMAGWHHRLNGLEFEQAPRVGDGQGGLTCCSPWGRKESDTTERLSFFLSFSLISESEGHFIVAVWVSQCDGFFLQSTGSRAHEA